ncbi:MAG: hypothetical protein CMM87_04830 [Rickettsiales bacterium]|nr:hypothetical protein [Rickettsiales bacterium]|tara:strand:- start:28312 stop:28512 length:201 start_codon:yes stop_codon:yes gene_type:complete
MDNKEKLKQKLDALVSEHKRCEKKLVQLMQAVVPNYLEIRSLKKNKLELKDQIQVIKNQINPDIIA